MKPIRCYTCGKVLGNKWCTVEKKLAEGMPMKEVYETIGISRYCCKRTVLASYDTTTHLPSLREEEDCMSASLPVATIPESVRVVSASQKTNFLKIM